MVFQWPDLSVKSVLDLLLSIRDLRQEPLLLTGVLGRLSLNVELLLLQTQHLRLETRQGPHLAFCLEGQSQCLPCAGNLGVVQCLLSSQLVELSCCSHPLGAAVFGVAPDSQPILSVFLHAHTVSFSLSLLDLELLLLNLDLLLLDQHLPLLQLPLRLENPPALGDRFLLLAELQVSQAGLGSGLGLRAGSHLHAQLVAAGLQGPAGGSGRAHGLGQLLLLVHQGQALLQRLDLVLVGLLLDVGPFLGDGQCTG